MTTKFASALLFMALALVATASYAADENLRLTTANGVCDKDSPAGTICIQKNQVELDSATTSGICVSSDTTLCLQNGRFQVSVTWASPTGETGIGHAVALSDTSGYFWFFSKDNVEILVKMLDGCPVNNQWWFFAAPMTNVQFALTVGDMTDLWGNIYTNRMNQTAPQIQATSAFACP